MLEGTPVSRRVDDWREVHPVRLRQGPEWLWDQDYPEGPASLPAGAFPGPEREPGDPGQGLSWHRLYREFPRASGLLRLSRPIRVGGRAAVVTSLDPGFYWGADRQRRLVWLRQVGDEWQVEGEVDLREQAPLELLQQWTHTGLQADYTPSAQSPLAEVTVEDPEVVWQGPFDALYGYRLRVRTRDGREDTFQVVTSSHPYFQGLAHNLIVTNGAPAEEVLAVIEAAFA